LIKHEEILALRASNPEVIIYTESLGSQIKKHSEILQALEARLNQNSINSINSSKLPSTDFHVREKTNPRAAVKTFFSL